MVAVEAQRNSGLDGLRGVAVISVVGFHAGLPGFGGGFVGVDVFFVLSGYLITSKLLGANGRSELSLWSFYKGRVLRLLPASATLIATVMLLAIVGVWHVPMGLPSLATLFSAANWAEMAGVAMGPLGHMWSLSIEAQFYLLWPFVIFYCARRWLPVAIGSLWLSMTVGRMVAVMVGVGWESLYFATYFRPDGLALGALVASVLQSNWYGQRSSRTGGRPGWFQAVAARKGGKIGCEACFLGTIAVMVAELNSDSASTYVVGLPLVTLATAASVLWIVRRSDTIGSTASILSWSPLTLVGRASYSLYLWHAPLFVMVNSARNMPIVGKAVVAVCLTVTATVVSYNCIEPCGRSWHSNRANARSWYRLGPARER